MASLNPGLETLLSDVFLNGPLKKMTIFEVCNMVDYAIEDMLDVINKEMGASKKWKKEKEEILDEFLRLNSAEAEKKSRSESSSTFEFPKEYTEIKFDVRELQKNGIDPFDEIMSKVKVLKEKEGLTIITGFRPLPLRKVMMKKGFICIEKRDENLFYTSFFRAEKKGHREEDNDFIIFSEEVLSELLKTIESMDDEEYLELDVRELAAPEPLEKILHYIDSQSQLKVIKVIHRQKPNLLPQVLEARGWAAVLFAGDRENESGDKNNIIVYVLNKKFLDSFIE